MKRLILAAILSATILAGGCATRQATPIIVEDPNALKVTIAKRGQGPGESATAAANEDSEETRASRILSACGKTTVVVVTACTVISLVILYAVASGGNAAGDKLFR